MALRSNEFLQRNELVCYQLHDILRIPTKNGYKFTVNDRSAFYDWYNAYFEVQFQLQRLADGLGIAQDQRATVHIVSSNI